MKTPILDCGIEDYWIDSKYRFTYKSYFDIDANGLNTYDTICVCRRSYKDQSSIYNNKDKDSGPFYKFTVSAKGYVGMFSYVQYIPPINIYNEYLSKDNLKATLRRVKKKGVK